MNCKLERVRDVFLGKFLKLAVLCALAKTERLDYVRWALKGSQLANGQGTPGLSDLSRSTLLVGARGIEPRAYCV